MSDHDQLFLPSNLQQTFWVVNTADEQTFWVVNPAGQQTFWVVNPAHEQTFWLVNPADEPPDEFLAQTINKTIRQNGKDAL
jgi:hypothetical protein